MRVGTGFGAFVAPRAPFQVENQQALREIQTLVQKIVRFDRLQARPRLLGHAPEFAWPSPRESLSVREIAAAGRENVRHGSESIRRDPVPRKSRCEPLANRPAKGFGKRVANSAE